MPCIRAFFPCFALGAALAVAAAGCGGGDSSTANTTTTTTTDSSSDTITLLAPQTVAPGESVGLGMQESGQSITSVTWSQTGGPSVVFHDGRGKMIGFDVPSAGSYSFEATIQTAGQGTLKRTFAFSASGSRREVNARLDRAVPEQSAVSLRAWHSFGDATHVTYSWQQLEGPTVTPQRTDQALLLFETPAVTSDTLLKWRVTVTTAGGRAASDEIWVLVDDTPIDESAAFWSAGMVVGPIHAYQADSPRAAALESCVYTNRLRAACRFATLPLIAQETTTPTVADVMNRVLVSHDWMGRRFEAFLTNADQGGDVRRLLRPVTAIVISADIRPSFYWDGTAAIYIDPADLWLTPDERDTILETPDFRSDFDKDLAFSMPWRLVRNNDYASYYYPAEWRQSRTLNETRFDLASLFYHELAHAGDMLPPSVWATLKGEQTPQSASEAARHSSDDLAATYPLASQEMRGLADVAFGGTTATAAQTAYQPADVSGFFVPDRAADFYSYSASAEDLAELFSFLMMRYRYGVDADIAVTDHPKGDDVTARDYIVAWGERGRIGQELIKPRVRFTAERVLPELDVGSALASLPAPLAMRPGEDWVANLDLGGGGAAGLRPGTAAWSRAVARPVERLPRHTGAPRLRFVR